MTPGRYVKGTELEAMIWQSLADEARIQRLEAAGNALAAAGGHARRCAVAERPLAAACDCGWEAAYAAWKQAKESTP